MPRISNLTALTAADGTDVVPILDTSATTTKKITKTALLSDIVDGTLIANAAIKAKHVDLGVADETARDAIASPWEGLTVFREDLDAFQVYDGTDWLTYAGKYPIGCKAIRSSTVSTPNATETTLSWNSEEYDEYGMHDNATNSERITVTEDGTYVVDAFAAWSGGVSSSAIRLYHNTNSIGFYYKPGSVTAFGECDAHKVVRLAAGDYIYCKVFQSSGASRNLKESESYLSVTKL